MMAFEEDLCEKIETWIYEVHMAKPKNANL